jgi:hypothetical protein
MNRQTTPSRGTLGRIAPPSGAPSGRTRMSPGFSREQPMSQPRARTGNRSANPGVNSRADFGRSRGTAPGGNRAAPRNTGGRASGGGGRLRGSNGGNRRAR